MTSNNRNTADKSQSKTRSKNGQKVHYKRKKKSGQVKETMIRQKKLL